MDLNKALEIHGCFEEDQEDDSSLSGKSEFDDEYFAQQPPPIVIDRSKVTVIVPEIEYINTNSSAKEKNSKTSSTIVPSHHHWSGDRGSPSLSHHSTFDLNYATREIVDSDNPAFANNFTKFKQLMYNRNVPKANEIETRVSIPSHQPPRSSTLRTSNRNRNVVPDVHVINTRAVDNSPELQVVVVNETVIYRETTTTSQNEEGRNVRINDENVENNESSSWRIIPESESSDEYTLKTLNTRTSNKPRDNNQRLLIMQILWGEVRNFFSFPRVLNTCLFVGLQIMFPLTDTDHNF